MRSFWYTPKQTAAYVSEVTGQPFIHEEISDILTPEELAGQFSGCPFMQGRQYGPMAIRAAQAKLLPKRASYLGEVVHKAMPPVVVSHYAKGGSGKTSAAVNAAIALAQRGVRVLFIDADPQSSATMLFGVDVDDDNLRTLVDLTFGRSNRVLPMEEAIIPLLENGVLDLIPSDPLLGTFDNLSTMVRGGRDHLFHRVLEANADTVKRYDIVIVDTNPSTSSPLNFVLAFRCDALLMSISMDALSMKSRRMMDSLFFELEQGQAPAKQVLVLANGFAPSTTHGQQSLRDLVRTDREMLMQTVIPLSAAVARQGWEKKPGGGMTLMEREPNTLVAKRYARFALELFEYVVWAPRQAQALSFDAPEIETIEAEVAEESLT